MTTRVRNLRKLITCVFLSVCPRSYCRRFYSIYMKFCTEVEDPKSSQLTAGYWQNGWLVVSVCLSVRARFGHISGTGRPINFVFWRAAEGHQARECVPCVSTPGEARQRQVYNTIRVDNVPSCELGSARRRPRVPSVRPSVRLSHGWISQKRLKLGRIYSVPE